MSFSRSQEDLGPGYWPLGSALGILKVKDDHVLAFWLVGWHPCLVCTGGVTLVLKWMLASDPPTLVGLNVEGLCKPADPHSTLPAATAMPSGTYKLIYSAASRHRS